MVIGRMMEREEEKGPFKVSEGTLSCKNCGKELYFSGLVKKGTHMVCPICGGNSFAPTRRGVDVK